MTPAELIQGYLDDSLSEAESQMLHDWLAEDPSHLDLFAADALIHSQLCGVLGDRKVRDNLLASAIDEAELKPEHPSNGKIPTTTSPVLGFLGNIMRIGGDAPTTVAVMWMLMAVLGSGLLAMFVWIVLTLRSPHVAVPHPEVANHNSIAPANTQAITVARLSRAVTCRWDQNFDSPQLGDALKSGRKLVLESGLAEIVFENGVQSVLEGPARLEIRANNAVCLTHGKFAVTVENPSARGFVVHTPGMKVTDLGTEFGVWVTKEGEQEIHVFRGRVQAEAADTGEGGRALDNPPFSKSSLPSPLLLTAHQAIRVIKRGRPVEQIAANERQFVRTEQMAAQVVAAKDNNQPSTKVVWQEMGESPGIVAMAVADKKIFACTNDDRLLVCDPVAATIQWKPIGDAPKGVVAMTLADGKLYVSSDVRARGRLLSRDAVETTAAWNDIGHAWCLVGMGAMPGAPSKIYAIVDTKEVNSSPKLMVRDSRPSKTASPARTEPGLDGLPWDDGNRAAPAGTQAFTVADGKFYAATKDSKLFVLDAAQQDADWAEIGDSAGAICLASDDDRLFASTASGKLLVWDMKVGNLEKENRR